jgi:imidazole glycerol-phosphate synthase
MPLLSAATHPLLPSLRPSSQIGGGIRSYTDAAGHSWSALDVAARYFRAGADKVSIGSDAVAMAEAYYARGQTCDGTTAIEEIARVYGSQAVVVSLDPKRVYVSDADGSRAAATAAGHAVLRVSPPGPQGEEWAWYQCTVKGGREGRPICARAVAVAVAALGAGELLVNCMDNDGQKAGYDEALLGALCAAVRIPLIASSGAGAPSHFSSVFSVTRCEAALAAGIFHRREVAIADVKSHLTASGIEVRRAP